MTTVYTNIGVVVFLGIFFVCYNMLYSIKKRCFNNICKLFQVFIHLLTCIRIPLIYKMFIFKFVSIGNKKVILIHGFKKIHNTRGIPVYSHCENVTKQIRQNITLIPYCHSL